MEDTQFIVSKVTISPAPLAPNLLSEFSLTLRSGDILGILGSNGIGKTTLLKCLAGCLPPKSGTLTLENSLIYSETPLIKQHIGFLPDTVPLIPYFTVQENLRWMAKFRGLPSKRSLEAIQLISEKLGIHNWLGILAKHLSLGQRKLVGIAGALIHQPKLIILDEPLNDLDTQVRERVLTVLQTLSTNGLLIFTSHYYRDLATIANKILLLEKGKSNWVLDKTTLATQKHKTPKLKIKKSTKILEEQPS
jgi:ABC-2 type transport system ATP-binding protein